MTTIRPAVAADADGLAFVHVRTWQAAYRGHMPDDYLDALDVGERAQRWRQWLSAPAPHQQAFVATAGDRIIGFAFVGDYRAEVDEGEVHPGDHVGELGAIYVLPEHWDTGTGRALMDAATQALAAEGFTEAALWVIEGNTRACRFYEAAGWRPDGATKLDPRGGVQIAELRYRRSLPAHGQE